VILARPRQGIGGPGITPAHVPGVFSENGLLILFCRGHKEYVSVELLAPRGKIGYKAPDNTPQEVGMAELGIFETIYSMRAIRRLKPDPIPEDVLQKIVDAGVHAPSGGNLQDWAFLLIRDPELKRFIRDCYWGMWQKLQGNRPLPPDLPPARRRILESAVHLAEHLHEVPVILLACAKKEYPPFIQAGSERASVATVHGSIYPAVQNILLACRALGIGSVITTIHCLFEDELKQKLSIPADVEISALLPLGYPQGTFGPTTRKPTAEVIHWDRWGQKRA
jgi:nitroreductase